MTVQSIEVSIAEISKDIKYIIKRLDENTQRFIELERQIAEHDRHINRLYGGIALATFIVPLIVAVIVRML